MSRPKLAESLEAWAGAAREWLRRVMPRVAVAAVALVVVRLALRGTWLYRETPARYVGVLALGACLVAVAYYGARGLARLKRALLWRVRRRLVITYLFVGLTPIVLLLALGLLTAIGGSSQALVRVVTVQHNATERQALQSARALAGVLAEAGAPAERETQRWLDERTALLQGTLPGARVSVWRGQRGAAYGPASYVSAFKDEARRGVGHDTGDARDPLPVWLDGQEEWSGLTFLPPPEDSTSAFATPSVRAVSRRAGPGGETAVLVTVPISRALVNFYRETTGVNVHPYFVDLRGMSQRTEGSVEVKLSDEEEKASVTGLDGRRREIDLGRDQFGEKLLGFSGLKFSYPVFLPATEWGTGESAPNWSFMVDWSWGEVRKQFWSDAVLGRSWHRALYSTALVFLVLEIMALLSAAWMTRAVTGTVHKLYRATERVKRGDFSHRIRTRSRDQLGELATAFNDMSADIESLLAERVEHERLKREVEIAHEVQEQLFPRGVPELPGTELAGECRAARGVAGDYYDFIEVAPGLVAFALGDVSGKGISAALVMSNLQATLRAQAAIISERMRLGAAAAVGEDGGALPCGVTGVDERCVVSRMVESINAQLNRTIESNRFATLFLGLYDAGARRLRYTNAGHNAPLLVRASGEVETLTEGGTMVGAFDWATYEEAQATLGEGDLLVVYSDGLSEARNHAGEEYGEQRLSGLVVSHRHETAADIRRLIFDEVDAWSAADEREDDQTLVILKG
ncbi:MAG TPA: SpoIIE family protein phosphatase [Pyrinomonadaceae bacterium]|jgi:sigma-B regulation protein RsbU (phosphoserine phosphatase)|nr:SpoIIE family protein phosphatase [Pyrinomonadaceae bacterium]